MSRIFIKAERLALSLAVVAGLGFSAPVHTRKSMTVSKSVVRQAQDELRDEGYYKGRVDGMVGPQTRRALVAFQHMNNIPMTGRLDSKTITTLGITTTSTGEASRMRQLSPSSQPSEQPTGQTQQPTGQTQQPSEQQTQPMEQQNQPSQQQTNPPSQSNPSTPYDEE